MTRPETPQDLDEYDRQGHTIARIISSNLVNYPSLGMHLLAALAEAQHLGLSVEDGEIRIPPTDKELVKKVESAQRSWDLGKKMHEQYLEDGEWPTSYWVWTAYLKAEGIEAPKKPGV